MIGEWVDTLKKWIWFEYLFEVKSVYLKLDISEQLILYFFCNNWKIESIYSIFNTRHCRCYNNNCPKFEVAIRFGNIDRNLQKTPKIQDSKCQKVDLLWIFFAKWTTKNSKCLVWLEIGKMEGLIKFLIPDVSGFESEFRRDNTIWPKHFYIFLEEQIYPQRTWNIKKQVVL